MATITSPEIIAEMLLSGGSYQGDPPPTSVWKYKSLMSGQTCFAVFYDENHNDIHVSPYVRDPVRLWNESVLTEEGREFLAEWRK